MSMDGYFEELKKYGRIRSVKAPTADEFERMNEIDKTLWRLAEDAERSELLHKNEPAVQPLPPVRRLRVELKKETKRTSSNRKNTNKNKALGREVRKHLHVGRVSKSKARLYAYGDAWINSLAVPQPNYLVTINLPHCGELAALIGNGTVSEYLNRKILPSVRSAAARLKAPLLWIGVIEAAGGLYHIHLLTRFPSKAALLKCLYPVWEKLAPDELHTKEAFKTAVFKSRSGTCVHATRVTKKKIYNDKAGAEGLIQYMAKDIDDTASEYRECRILQPILISRGISGLVGCHRRFKGGVWYVLAESDPPVGVG